MNVYGNLAVTASFDSSSCALLTTYPTSKNAFQEEEVVEFSTIDGEVITSVAGTNALKRGAGILIGDYFVGISECLSNLGSRPFLRY
jgi:hypothetical protein